MTGEARHLNRSRKRVWEPPVNSSEGKMLLAEGGANAKARRWKCTEQGQGAAKRLVWKDLLQVKSELRGRPDATEPTRNRKDKLLCL